MNAGLQRLRAEIAEVKAAGPFSKLEPAERALDSALACIESLEQRITKREKEKSDD